MFFRAVTTPLMTPVPNFNKWCAVSNFLFKNIDFCIFTPKTPLVKENYFLTLWNFTYLKDTSFGKKLCNFELGLETKNEFKSGLFITLFQCIDQNSNLSNIEKFIYLKNSLTGDPKQALSGILISNENYKNAKTLLKEIFEDIELLKRTYFA